jgi:dTDP-4-dehydrorhamnose reductase
LGRELISRLPGEAIGLTRADVDVTDAAALHARLADLRPTVVVNCTAYNLVDKAEEEPDVALAANAWAVRSLARICAGLNATLVHFSTDYVFGLDGQRSEPYVESDAPGPLSVYGMSKLMGEYAVRGGCPRHYVIRTCGLYGQRVAGGKGGNFVTTMLRLANEGKDIRVVDDQRLTPSSAADVAIATMALLQTDRPGLYHLTNAGDCTWFEFAEAVFALAGVSARLTRTTSAAYGSKARRPSYSVLRSRHDHAPRLPHWREALAKYLAAQ